MDDNRACRAVDLRSPCTTTTTYKAPHITITTIITHLVQHPWLPSYLPRFTTSRPFSRKLPNSHAGILGHMYTRLLLSCPSRIRRWTISLDTPPSPTDFLDSRSIRSTVPSPSGSRGST